MAKTKTIAKNTKKKAKATKKAVSKKKTVRKKATAKKTSTKKKSGKTQKAQNPDKPYKAANGHPIAFPQKAGSIDIPQFEKLCAMITPKNEIAAFFRISEGRMTTLLLEYYREHGEKKGIILEPGEKLLFQDLYHFFQSEGRVSLRRAQYTRALAGSDQMLKHLGEHILGQVPNKNVNMTGSIHDKLVNAMEAFNPETDTELEIDVD